MTKSFFRHVLSCSDLYLNKPIFINYPLFFPREGVVLRITSKCIFYAYDIDYSIGTYLLGRISFNNFSLADIKE